MFRTQPTLPPPLPIPPVSTIPAPVTSSSAHPSFSLFRKIRADATVGYLLFSFSFSILRNVHICNIIAAMLELTNCQFVFFVGQILITRDIQGAAFPVNKYVLAPCAPPPPALCPLHVIPSKPRAAYTHATLDCSTNAQTNPPISLRTNNP